mmetsp:Transcript_19160/g.56412  ORF Transcript_19160/g.56412 Transcript_19160/m.56412 type:complete len:201 (+) Transcript_19160:439-1041(+)
MARWSRSVEKSASRALAPPVGGVCAAPAAIPATCARCSASRAHSSASRARCSVSDRRRSSSCLLARRFALSSLSFLMAKGLHAGSYNLVTSASGDCSGGPAGRAALSLSAEGWAAAPPAAPSVPASRPASRVSASSMFLMCWICSLTDNVDSRVCSRMDAGADAVGSLSPCTLASIISPIVALSSSMSDIISPEGLRLRR